MLAEIITVYNIFQLTLAKSLIYHPRHIIERLFYGFTFRRNQQVMLPRNDSKDRKHASIVNNRGNFIRGNNFCT